MGGYAVRSLILFRRYHKKHILRDPEKVSVRFSSQNGVFALLERFKLHKKGKIGLSEQKVITRLLPLGFGLGPRFFATLRMTSCCAQNDKLLHSE